MSNPIPDKLFWNLRKIPLTDRRLRRFQHLQLSPKRYEVLKLLARGLSNQQIADELGCGVETVYTDVKMLYDYFNLTGYAGKNMRTALVVKCFRERIV